VLLHEILGLDEGVSIFLAEESLEDLSYLPVTEALLSQGQEAAEVVEIHSDLQRLGIAYHIGDPADIWVLVTDIYSDRKVLEGCNAPLGRKVRTGEDEFMEALIEYFALSLAEELFCDSCSVQGPPLYVPDRIDRLESFLRPILPAGMSILEICCGGGMATQALLRLGHSPLSMDYDRCDLCQALKNGKLQPRKAFVLDARMLDRFIDQGKFDAVVGFMVGLIDDINWAMWQEIIARSSMLARNLALYTVYTEKEARRIAKVLSDQGFEVKIIDNQDPSGIYDQWACLGLRRKG
jgi:hypothetical protein